MGEWVNGWTDGCVGGKGSLRIAYSNQKHTDGWSNFK